MLYQLPLFPAYNDAKAVVQDEDEKKKKRKISLREELNNNNIEMDARSTSKSNNNNSDRSTLKGGMVLPFQPLSLSFNHINYFVDTPSVSHSFNLVLLSLFLFRISQKDITNSNP